MEEILIYHNNRCTKSRCALDVLSETGKPFAVVKYLEKPPTLAELKNLKTMLGLPASAMVRSKETVYSQLFAGKKPTETELLKAIASHPVLLERPIVVKGNQAWIVRNDDAVAALKKILK
ncbi:MAG: arsenate reductase [Bacteroidetes bacterium]|nr:arsenate reductase [Bacteroidota bacterium]